MAGRPSSLTAARTEDIGRAVRGGASLRMAADLVGIPYKTVLGWRRLGEQARECEVEGCADPHHGPTGGEISYATFAEEVQKAEGQVTVRAVLSVTNRFDDPKNGQWFLERRCPEFRRPSGRESERQEVERTRPPFVIQMIPSDRPQAEIDELMRDIDPTPGSPPRADVVDDSERTATGAAADEAGDDNDEHGARRDPGAPARQAATPPEPGPDEEDDEDPSTWRDPFTGRLLDDINAEAEERDRIHRGERP